MPTSKKIILGLDPGIADTGWGVIVKNGHELTVVDCGSISTPAKMEMTARLKLLHVELVKIMKKYKPEAVSVEQLFFARNVTTALIVGQARGVCLLTIAEHNLPLFEFTPLQVKQALTSYGKADKQQVGNMVKAMLKLTAIPKPDDAADALAIAITCANSTK